MFHAITLFCVLSAIFIDHVDCRDSSKNQISNSNSNEFLLWFVNETTLTVLWEGHSLSSQVKEYKFYIKPPGLENNVRFIRSRREPILLNFTKLVPGRSYTIIEETSSEEIVTHTSSVVYRTKPLQPSAISTAEQTLTTHSFEITWEPPADVCDFDKFELSVSSFTPLATLQIITKTFDKLESRDYVVDQNVLPGHSYRVDVRTISGLIASKPITLDVTLKPLPVVNITITGDSMLVWHVHAVSQQNAFQIKVTSEDSSKREEILVDKKELFIGHLSPGRKYLIQIEAISHDIRSEAISVSHITPPLPPVLKHVNPVHDGLEVTWQSVNYGQEMFQVVFHRVDAKEARNVSTNNTQVLLSHLYPGALYGVRVFSISKYSNYSSSSEISQGVMPLPPCNVSASYINVTTLSVSWNVLQDSLISGNLVRYRTEDQPTWKEIASVADATSLIITDLLSGERYKIQVSCISHDLESSPVELQWTTPPAPVTQVVPLPSSNTITLKFPQPQGRVDFFNVTWSANGTQTTKLFSNKRNNIERFVLISTEDLTPGVSYMFTFTSVSYQMESSVTTLIARTWPLKDSELLLWDTGSSLTIKYVPPKILNFDVFRFNLSESEHSARTIDKSVHDNNTSVQFDSEIPGKLYTLHIWTVSDAMLSLPTQLQYRTQPGTVREVNATIVTNNSVTLSWKKPQGEFSKFEVVYLDSVLQTLVSSVNITQLQPYQNYTFQMRTLAGLEGSLPTRSSAVLLTVQTLESRPAKVSNFHPVNVNADNITFVWSLQPQNKHGVITQFKLSCILGEWSKMIDILPERRSFTVTGLKPGRTYLFKIQARTKAGYGPAATWEQVMPVLAPPRPAEQLVPTPVLQTTSTIQIRFCKSFFSNEHGDILYYTFIVSEDLLDNTSSILNLPGWRDVQTLHPWPPYQVTSPYQFFTNSSTDVDFTVGEETCVADVEYCNGPLKSGTTYKIKIRAFTRKDLFTDTAYSIAIRTKQNFTSILYLSVVLVSVFVLVLVAFIRRRISSKAQDISLQNRCHPVSVNYFQTLRSDTDPSWILSEFEDLRLFGKEQTTIAAELPCNRPKNRFSNILPYDHSRYKLQPVDDEDGSDYVNANYIAGHASPRQYIATQGPLSTTQDEFWRMCWESRTPAIVMLTQCVEKGREKCYRYWPTGERPLRCGDIDVRLLQDVCHYPGWSINRLRLSRGRESRVTYHFHFTTWPDSGVPQTPETLVRFVVAFRTRVSPEQNPIIVHCSAGVGRTGTFIAVDTIAQTLHKVRLSGLVDILGVVCQLRKQRMCMVQTVEQYLYIYLCVKLLLQGGGMTSYSESQDLVFSNDAFELDEGVDDL